MKRIMAVLAWLFVIPLLSVASAVAVPIVDTGPGSDPINSPVLYSNGSYGNQWVAAQFTINQTYFVDSIKGYMSGEGVGGDGLISLYSGAALPTVGSAIFNTSFAIPQDYVADWYGATGLNLRLDAGTYWVAFEAAAANDLYASLPGGVPNPLAAYAYWNGSSYQQATDFNFGVMIQPVPEPATMLLMATGLAGSALVRKVRRRTKQQI